MRKTSILMRANIRIRFPTNWDLQISVFNSKILNLIYAYEEEF